MNYLNDQNPNTTNKKIWNQLKTPLIKNTPEAGESECDCNTCRNLHHYLRIIEKLNDEDKKWMGEFLNHYIDWSSDYIELFQEIKNKS